MPRLSHHRVAVVGNSGSGKSTLVHGIGATCPLPVKHLDQIFWTSGWNLAAEAEFNWTHESWLAGERWIIEGVGNWHSLGRRFEVADLIVFLDTPRELCRSRAARRRYEDEQCPNPFIAAGCRYAEVAQRQEEVIDLFDRTLGPEVMKLLASYASSKATLVLDGRQPTDALGAQLLAKIEAVSDGTA